VCHPHGVDAAPRGPAVTVAVVSWNTRALLADCLESLRDDARENFAAVWVVDNASSDGSAELVRERFPWVTLIASAQNLGFGAAVNAVARRTESPWIAPANADIRLGPGALRKLVAAGERHPEAAVVAPRLLLPDGATQQSVYPFPTAPLTIAYLTGALRLSRRLADHWCIGRGFDPGRERDVPWAVGAFLLVRRSAWDDVGGFDEAQWMYAEDLDLGWRLRRAGWNTRYVPEARITHAESAATKHAWGDGRHRRWHASSYAWMARRRGLPVTRLIAAINVVGFLTRAIAASSLTLIGCRRGREAGRREFQAARSHAIGLRPRDVLQRIR
jgi:N-acetylglucosaminyl-diphospho-decaprenol L-rhamnosyltransferase